MVDFKVDEVKKGNLGMISLLSGVLAVVLFFVNVMGYVLSLFLNFFCCAGCLLQSFLCLTTIASVIAAIAAIVVGIIALASKKQKWKGMAFGGIGLGFLYFVLYGIFILLIIIFAGISTIANL